MSILSLKFYLRISSLLLLMLAGMGIYAQNVGINTTSPIEKFHMNNGNLLITGPQFIEPNEKAFIANDGNAYTKFLWIGNRSALRAGRSYPNEWHPDSIGAYSFAFGRDVNAPGNASATFGIRNRTGDFSFAAGVDNMAYSAYSVAFGSDNRVESNYSMITGRDNISKSEALAVVGRYNDTTGMNSPFLFASNNPLFVVGNGTAHNQRSNAMTVLGNGRVGIGVSTPGAPLDVSGSSSFPQLRLRSTTNDYVRIRMFNTVNSAPFWDVASLTSGNLASTARMNFFYSNTGAGGADVLSLQGNGNATLWGVLTQNSDERLKKNITPIDNSIEALNQLNGYHYNWKDQLRDSATQTGLLAQEVEKIMPELVKEDEKGTKSVNYNGLIPYLLEAVKSLSEENKAMRKEMEQLKKK